MLLLIKIEPAEQNLTLEDSLENLLVDEGVRSEIEFAIGNIIDKYMWRPEDVIKIKIVR